MSMRTHYCGQIDETLIGQTVTLAGWTDVARNLGGVCFIDLRDHEGIVQVTVEPANAEVFAVAASLGYEDVIQVEGVVRARHAVNDRIRTGKVEVIATRITILNKAETMSLLQRTNDGEANKQLLLAVERLADLYTILALAPGGPSWFVVERGAEGLSHGKGEDKHGIRASNTAARQNRRAARAIDRLIRSGTPLAGIAADEGFADQAHLSRVISQATGWSPGRLRRRFAAG